MDAQLQTRVQLLGAVFVAFTLLAGPMFVQVKADRSESLANASGTLLAEWGREFALTIQPRDPSALTVEDYWGDQARQNNPECGAQCDPDGDMDGDGVSNADELEAGRNPACNEEEHGTAFCQGQDNSKLVDPEDPNATIEPRWDLLVDVAWQDDGVRNDSAVEVFASFDYHYDRFVVYLNATARDQGFDVFLFNETQVALWTRGQNAPNPFLPGSSLGVSWNDTVAPAHPGTYGIQFDNRGDGFFPEVSSARIQIFGQLDGR